MRADLGTGRPSNSNNQTSGAGTAGPITFDRMSFVSLSHDSLGEVRRNVEGYLAQVGQWVR